MWFLNEELRGGLAKVLNVTFYIEGGELVNSCGLKK
jgi:hypothetical protein